MEESLEELVLKQFQLFETRLDTQEELIANLVLAHSEMTSSIEVVIQRLMSPCTEEEKREFRVQLKAQHLELLAMMQEASRGMDAASSNFAPSVETMADQQPPTSTSE